MSKRKPDHKSNPGTGTSANPVNQLPGSKIPWFENALYISITIVLFISIYAYIFDKKPDLNGDNAFYYVLGKALSHGEGYVNIANINKSPDNHYPPGYPFILSVFMHISDSFVFLKLLNGFFLLVNLLLFFFLFYKISENPRISFITTFFLAINSHLLLYGTMLMSELSFTLFSFLCIILVLNTDFDKNIFRKPNLYLILVTLIASYYIRATGLALFGGLLLFLILKKNWKPAVFIFGGFVAGALPWILRGQRLGGSSYLKPLVMINPYRPELGNAHLVDYFNRFFDNLTRYITREIPSVLFPFKTVNYLNKVSFPEWFIGMLLLGLMIYGLYVTRKKVLFIICYLAGTFGILLLWPEVWRGVRFVLPVAPILLFAVLSGAYALINTLFKSLNLKLKINPLLFGILAVAFMPSVKSLHRKASNDYPANWKNYFQIARYFKKENLSDAVVACRKPMLFYLQSGTYTTNYLYSKDPQEILDNLIKGKVSYVVLDNLGYRQTYEYLYPAINKNQNKFQVVLQLKNPDTYLLKFSP